MMFRMWEPFSVPDAKLSGEEVKASQRAKRAELEARIRVLEAEAVEYMKKVNANRGRSGVFNYTDSPLVKLGVLHKEMARAQNNPILILATDENGKSHYDYVAAASKNYPVNQPREDVDLAFVPPIFRRS